MTLYGGTRVSLPVLTTCQLLRYSAVTAHMTVQQDGLPMALQSFKNRRNRNGLERPFQGRCAFSKYEAARGRLANGSGASFYDKAANLVRLKDNQDSVEYCQTFHYVLLPFVADMLGETCTFQHVNASIHRSKYTKKWFEEKYIDVKGWPSRSPDLNTIENIWGLPARKVYANGRQFKDLEGLTDASGKRWEEID